MPPGARGFLLLAACAASCRHSAPVTSGVAEPPPAFSHSLAPHGAVQCAECHATGTVPTHPACARCHGDWFAPAAIAAKHVEKRPCVACHEPQPVRLLAARFSHRLHLDRARMESATGFHDDCQDCHAAGADGGAHRAEATHEACARCHDQKAPQMASCRGCHGGTAPIEIGRRLIHGDLAFSHARHQLDRVGRATACRYCHENADDARTVRDVAPPEIQRCTLCHEDRRVTPPEVRMSRCEGCHLSAAGGAWAGVLAPRTHQLGTTAPDDHDLAFRRDHAQAARSAGARCAQCHQGLSGSPRDSCGECHATMRPRDHTITWREVDHGREAAAVRGRCVQCHQANYCESCHSVPPRTHLPLVQWVSRGDPGHGLAAKLNLRSCFACHTFESSCIACHQRGLR